jgi:hypothetical protein
MVVVNVNKNNTYSVNDVYQWDKNRILTIYGLNFTYLPEIHFAKGNMSVALVKQATIDENGIASVEIPNSLLETATPIKVYICSYNGEEFISKYAFTINVKARVKPADYIAEDDEKIYSYNALENLVNATVINLELNNAKFHGDIIAEVEALNEQTKKDVENIVNNATIANADTLDDYHAEDFVFNSKAGTTKFKADGSIETIYADGSKEIVVFNVDGSITKTIHTKEIGTKTETTVFNSDGSITVSVG